MLAAVAGGCELDSRSVERIVEHSALPDRDMLPHSPLIRNEKNRLTNGHQRPFPVNSPNQYQVNFVKNSGKFYSSKNQIVQKFNFQHFIPVKTRNFRWNLNSRVAHRVLARQSARAPITWRLAERATRSVALNITQIPVFTTPTLTSWKMIID